MSVLVISIISGKYPMPTFTFYPNGDSDHDGRGAGITESFHECDCGSNIFSRATCAGLCRECAWPAAKPLAQGTAERAKLACELTARRSRSESETVHGHGSRRVAVRNMVGHRVVMEWQCKLDAVMNLKLAVVGE